MNDHLGVPTLLGIPFDGESSYLRGAGDAPAKIRAALRSDACNMWTELGLDLAAAGAFEDAGDLEFIERHASPAEGEHPRSSPNCRRAVPPTTEQIFAAIEDRVGSLIDAGRRPVLLGGDHSITFPIVKAFGRNRRGQPSSRTGLTIFHFDAHPDLYGGEPAVACVSVCADHGGRVG